MKVLPIIVFGLIAMSAAAGKFTRQDILRRSNGTGRSWWDVKKYDLSIDIDTATRSIKGISSIEFDVITHVGDSMQIDLQEPMVVDSVFLIKGRKDTGSALRLPVVKEGNVWWVSGIAPLGPFKRGNLIIWFHGKPREAKRPPWEGGLVWGRDSTGKQWISVVSEGPGASCWWPCKDYTGDEANSMTIQTRGNYMYRPITNGRFGYSDSVYVKGLDIRKQQWMVHGVLGWKVHEPINTNGVTFYIGNYSHWHDTLNGEKGILDLDFYPLGYNESKARTHWAVTKQMLHCFEYWMGPYPFYKDGYKLIEAPYIGKGHQGAIAYGNQYKMGYLGRDRNGVPLGLSFDYMLVHESAYEWFGNSITPKDIADNWVQEGFTTYMDALFIEWIKGKDSAFAYRLGSWGDIHNFIEPIIGPYSVNKTGSADVYYKGASVVHMIRMILHDDERFRQLLHGLNKTFYHKTVTTKEIEDYISTFAGIDLKGFFDGYLRTPNMPVVFGSQKGNVVTLTTKGFGNNFKLPIYNKDGRYICELSSSPTTIPIKDLGALWDYKVIYTPSYGSLSLPER